MVLSQEFHCNLHVVYQVSVHVYLPIYLRCNTVKDCRQGLDELHCDSFLCPGFFRCWKSQVCVHPLHVCDGIKQCPYSDDELLCYLDPCPSTCNCQGHAFNCRSTFPAFKYKELRYIDATGSGLEIEDFRSNKLLIVLKLSSCNISRITDLPKLQNLQTLDLSFNNLIEFDVTKLIPLNNIQKIILSNNPISTLSVERYIQNISLRFLDLSSTHLEIIDMAQLASLPMLQILNVSHGKLQSLNPKGNFSMLSLQVLDLQGSFLQSLQQGVLKTISVATKVFSSNYRICCPMNLPENFNLQQCSSPKEIISSCTRLLKSNISRFTFWLFFILTVIGK